MIVTIKWLNDFVNLSKFTPKEIAQKFTQIGFEVDEIKYLNKGLERVMVGQIELLSKHPNADKLQICKINLGNNNYVQIITAATNVFEGAIVPCALDGADLPCGIKIKESSMRGEISQGMLCGFEEIGVDNSIYPGAENDGIMILDKTTKVGQNIAEVVGLDDVVLDISVLANRPDCQSVYGLAKELAVALDLPFLEPNLQYNSKHIDLPININIQSANCISYFSTIVDKIKLADSPEWIRNRLRLVGVGIHNNIVDLTNYVLYEMGQPLHTFDYNTIKDNTIIIRQANDNENIIALDNITYNLNSSMCVIADTQNVLGIAGIKGGVDSSISANTSTILLESAVFVRESVRKTSRILGLRTDASARFERGVTNSLAQKGLQRFLSLISQLGIGEISNIVLSQGEIKDNTKTITLPLSKFKQVLGIEISQEIVINILNKLGIRNKIVDNQYICDIPAERIDIDGENDIVEEVIRFYGLEHLLATNLPTAEQTAGVVEPILAIKSKIAEYMLTTGANQTFTYTFRAPKELNMLLINNTKYDDCLVIQNPLSPDYSIMRNQMIGSLMEIASQNLAKQNKNFSIFEIGKIFFNNKDELPIENYMLSYLTVEEGKDFFSVKSIVEMLANNLGLTFQYEKTNIPFLHPNISANIVLGKTILGVIGKIHPVVCKNYEIKEGFYFELNINLLPSKKLKKIKALAKYPSASRDIAVVVDENIAVGDIMSLITKTAGVNLENLELLDIYQGQQLPNNSKSVAFGMTFRKQDDTMTQEEVNNIWDTVLAKLQMVFNAKLR